MTKIAKTAIAYIITLILFLPGITQAEDSGLGIAVIVNDNAITFRDIRERSRFILLSSGIRPNAEILKRIRPQVIEDLIEEQLKIQEAKANNLTVEKSEVENAFKAVAQQNHMSVDQFSMILKQQGISAATFKNQLKAKIAWNKVVENVLMPKIDVSPVDVDTAMDRMKQNIDKQEFLVAAIFLPASNKKEETEAKKLGERLLFEIRNKKAPFSAIAMQFSKMPDAKTNGGDMGWIQEDMMNEYFEKPLKTMSKGEVSNLIKTPSGYYILLLRDKRTISEKTLPSREELTNKIGMKRLNSLQKHYLAELKSSAFIEYRD